MLKHGNKYSAEYVNTLAHRLRMTTPDIDSIVCYTDNADGIEDHLGIDVRMLPPLKEPLWGWWWKPWIVAHHETGDNIFIDLDMLITGDMAVFVPYKNADITLLSNRGVKINSSIISWHEPVHAPWIELMARRDFHVNRPAPWGDQEVFEICQNRGEITWAYHSAEWVGWLNKKQDARPVSRLGLDHRVIVCKGPRNPHENRDNPYVKEYWRR
jgi:hypothetical protein